jgi:L-asparaginase
LIKQNIYKLLGLIMQFKKVSLLCATILCSTTVLANKPHVEIYATGGTIAGSSASNTDTTNYKAGSIGVENLIQAVPELNKVAHVSGQQIANIASSDIDQATLLKLSKAINQKLSDKNVSGAVVTHGTDTLEETAFFLDLTVKSPKPVVLVGAMRPATAISADGPMNLLEAVALAAHPDAKNRGAMVVLNDRIASAYYVTKTNSTTIDTFKSIEQGYLGTFIGTTPKFYYNPTQAINKPYFNINHIQSLPKVSILYVHQDQDVALLDAAVKNGAQGLVLAGNGNGSVPTALKEKINNLMQQGIPVVRSTRTGSGYVSAKEEGIGAGYFNPQKARMVLALALAHNNSMDKIKTYFE